MKKWFNRNIQDLLDGKNLGFGLSLILFTIVIFIFFLPWLITRQFSFLSSYRETGQVGDTINGIAGPFIALLAAVLTFLAFRMQYASNKSQQVQFKKQAEDTFIERFEGRFFEMIRLHRANVDEQNVQGIIEGRKVFTTYYFELRFIFFTLSHFHETNRPSVNLSQRQLTNIAYMIFFFGIGHVTDSIFNKVSPELVNADFFKKTILHLKLIKSKYVKSDETTETRITYGNREAVFKFIYEPFTGHGTKIGHYYRHLFQTVKYVSKQKHPIFTEKFKYSYIKILRAQLSNIELVMFYYNALSSLGKPWITKGFIKKYKLLRNLPLSYADFGVDPLDQFAQECENNKSFFDWNNLKL